MATENVFEEIMGRMNPDEWNREMSDDAKAWDAKYQKVATIAELARDFNTAMADVYLALPGTPSQATTDAITAYKAKISASFELMMNETLLGRTE